MPTLFSRSQNLVMVVASLALLAACSGNKDASLNIGIGLSPDEAFIVPGTGSSCVALGAAKASDDPPTTDISGERVTYGNFRLQWRSEAALTIVSMKATVKGFGLDGEEQTIDIPESEIAALLGLEDRTIAAEAGRREETIDSSSTRLKGPNSPYAPCGLQLGGLKSKEGIANYTISVRLDLVGFSTASDGAQSPVRQSVTARAEKF